MNTDTTPECPDSHKGNFGIISCAPIDPETGAEYTDAIAEILFKDDDEEDSITGVRIHLDEGGVSEKDEEINGEVFYYCGSVADLESLKDPDGVEDFVVLDYYLVTMPTIEDEDGEEEEEEEED